MKRDSFTGRILKMTTDEFINNSKTIHGNKYNYSKTIYDGSNKK